MIKISSLEDLIKKQKERIQLMEKMTEIRTKLIRVEGVIIFLEEKIRKENEEKEGEKQ